MLVLPELIALRAAVDDQLGAHRPAQVCLALAGHDADRNRPARQRVLGGVSAQATAGSPDQDVVALLHRRAVVRDQLPEGGRVHQARRRGLLPGEVLGLGHQLVGLDQRQLGQPAEVGLVAPDALLRVEHGVVVPVGAFQLHRQAVGDDLLTRLPDRHPGAGAQHHPCQVRADHVIRQVVPRGERRQLPVTAQEGEGGHRREDGAPHGVVVDRARHDGDQGLTHAELGDRHLLHVQGLARVPVAGVDAVEHVLLVPVQGDCPVGLRQRQRREISRLAARIEDGVEDFLHDYLLPGSTCTMSAGRLG